MIRTALAGAPFLLGLALLASACGPRPDAAPRAEAPATVPVPGAEPAAGLDFKRAVSLFDPTKNHIVWALPPGIHGEAPWELVVTVKHKGEVKHVEKIPLKAEVMPAGAYTGVPAGYEAVRLSDGGAYHERMDAVQKVIEDLIARFGRGDGELVMMTEINTALDDAGRQRYCPGPRDADVRAYLDEGDAAKLVAIDMTPMKAFIAAEVHENCPPPLPGAPRP